MFYNDRLTVFEKMTKEIPEYSDDMYLKGYKDYEILQAAHKSLYKMALQNQDRIASQKEAQEESSSVDIRGEVYLNGRKIR